MNISITNACNRRCAYCFQKDWYLSAKANGEKDPSVIEMTTEDFSKLCDWSMRYQGFKLMGGEPLLHSRLTELVQIAKAKQKKVSFISNISVEPERFDEVLKMVKEPDSNIISFLVNTDYPAVQEKVFQRNFLELLKTKVMISMSTTLLPGEKEIEKSRARIAQLADIYKSVRGSMQGCRIRLAPFCPNPTDSTRFHVYDFTFDVMKFINALHPTGIQEYGFDCPVNMCELRDDFVDACREIGTRLRVDRCSPEAGMPFDILVDNSVIWCSSANFLRLKDWRDYPNEEAAQFELSKQYYAWWRKHGETAKCKSCDKHNPGWCAGFCIAKTASIQGINVDGTKKVIPVIAETTGASHAV